MKGGFWTWLLDVYRKPGVSEALIALQDRDGLNVNSILFCAWLTCGKARLSRSNALEMERLSKAWSDAIVAPVRLVRRTLKTTDLITEDQRKDVRKRVQDIEIALEELHCLLLEQRAASDLQAPQDEPEALKSLAKDNLSEYLAAHEMADRNAIGVINSQEWQTIITAAGWR